MNLKKIGLVSLIAANVVSVPVMASAQEINVNSVTDAVYQENVLQDAVDSNFDFKKEAAKTSALEADIALKDHSEKLTPEEVYQMSAHINKILSILDSFDEDGAQAPIQVMGYDESTLSKAIELTYNVNLSGLSTLEILSGANASIPARKAGEAYALAHGWGTTTWDNSADALRHFSWNFLMGQRIGVNAARGIADNHEAALAAAKRAGVEMAGLPLADQTGYGVGLINNIFTATRASELTFNATFDKSSIMDINNNSTGRKYSQRTYAKDDYMSAFNDAYKDLEHTNENVDNTDSTHAWITWQ
jgi:hypothetical protein